VAPLRESLPSRDTALLMGGAALVLSFTPSLVARRRRDQAQLSALAALLGAAAGTAGEMAVVRLAGRLDGGEPAARTVLASGAVLASALRLPAHPTSAVALAGSGAMVAGTAAVLGAVAPERRWDGFHDPRVIFIAVAAAGGGAAFAKARKRRRRPHVKLEDWPEGYPETVSGGTGSHLPRAALDFEGKRFLGTTLRAERIARLREDGLAHEPIRVFAGCGSAATVEERCALAVDSSSASARSPARASSSARRPCAATSTPSRSRPRSSSRAATSRR